MKILMTSDRLLWQQDTIIHHSQRPLHSIKDITLWNVLDEHSSVCGQAAMYQGWKFL